MLRELGPSMNSTFLVYSIRLVSSRLVSTVILRPSTSGKSLHAMPVAVRLRDNVDPYLLAVWMNQDQFKR